MKKLDVRLFVGSLVFILAAAILTRGQTGAIQYFAPPAGTTTANCGTPTSGFPLCGVATGWYVWSGTAWVQLGVAAAPAGVTSWNGQTGVVTYTPPAPPVVSVNGKTGAVVLGATTTVTTPTATTTLQ